ncbi:MAG: ATP-binding protein [Nitrospirota bacterium]
MIKRHYKIGKLLKQGKVLVIYGPRRVGKTTLLENFLDGTKLKFKYDNGDNIRVQNILGSGDFEKILEYVAGYELLAIDEAQMIPGIGTGLKIIADQAKRMQVIATGSSSFDLSQQIGEPLTGRKETIILYPISQKELSAIYNRYELKEKLDEFLVFGSYPEVVTAKTKKEKVKILAEIVDSYLLKDILALENIKSPKTLLNLLKLLAFQIGNLVSLNELAGQLSVNIRTVARYLDLLEKSFVIRSVGGFSRNLRKEVTKKMKYYFLDNGIRNAVIAQFNELENRNDVGALWENFIFCERLKKLSYESIHGYTYFWRAYSGYEIDLVEDRDGKLFGYEIKWSKGKKHPPKEWLKTYKNANYKVISRDNYLEFIL